MRVHQCPQCGEHDPAILQLTRLRQAHGHHDVYRIRHLRRDGAHMGETCRAYVGAEVAQGECYTGDGDVCMHTRSEDMAGVVTLSKEARAGMDKPTAQAIERIMTGIRDTCHARYAIIEMGRPVTPADAPEIERIGMATWEVLTLQLAWDSKTPTLTKQVLTGMYVGRRDEIEGHVKAMAANMTRRDSKR